MHLYLLVEEFLQPRKMQILRKDQCVTAGVALWEEGIEHLSFQPHVALRVSPSLGHEKQ